MHPHSMMTPYLSHGGKNWHSIQEIRQQIEALRDLIYQKIQGASLYAPHLQQVHHAARYRIHQLSECSPRWKPPKHHCWATTI